MNIPFDKPRTIGFRTAPLEYRGTTATRRPHRRNANRAGDQWVSMVSAPVAKTVAVL
jgi:hypothetical protein